MSGQWVDCKDRLPPVPQLMQDAKRYKVVIENGIDMHMLEMRSSGEVTATFDDLGWCVAHNGNLIDVKPSRWFDKEEGA